MPGDCGLNRLGDMRADGHHQGVEGKFLPGAGHERPPLLVHQGQLVLHVAKCQVLP